MRVPSSRGIRGLLFGGRGCLFLLLICALLGSREASAQTVARSSRETGRINFVTTGGSLRNSSTNTCNLNSTSTTALAGIPATTTIRAAWLYWGGSGGTADTSVTLNGNTVTASRTFAATYTGVNPNLPYFGAVADVRTIVQNTGIGGNGNYTFGGLGVVTGSPHCDVSAVVSGWALFVVYEGAGERVRAINIFDGLQAFRGGSITQTPNGFRVPNSNIDGRIGVFTLEGDPANSEQMNNIDEALRYNGALLDDGINVTGSDPLVQQFDGTINTAGISTSYGIDVDRYDISALLTPGQTSGTMTYSSGADLVLLMAQIVSATSDPGVDLAAAITHSGNFVAGGTGQYTITVSNVASTPLVEREDNTVTVTDTLPAGLTFSAASGSGWTCGAVGQLVTCTHAAPLNVGASFPDITLTVNVLESAPPNVTNTVVVSTPSFELSTVNNSASDTAVTIDPDLSASTKTVLDLNGGDAAPGDTLRYTITLTESAGGQAVNVAVTDHVPANSTFNGFVSIPAGSTSAFSPPPNGDNDKGLITVSGITVPASSTRTVVFDVTVDNVTAGALIANTATVANPNGPDATPVAPTIIVLAGQMPGNGTKQLYLWSNQQRLSRTRPTGTHNAIDLDEGGSTTFTLNPALQTALTLNAGNFNVNLLLQRTDSTATGRTVRVVLSNSSLGTIDTEDLTFTQNTSALIMYPLVLNTTGVVAPVGSTFSLQVTNLSTGFGQRSFNLVPYSGANYSRVDLNSATIINVNSVQTWTQTWNTGTQQGTWYPGNTLFVRAQISDPFGSFDISGATISLINAAGTTVVDNVAMTAQGAAAGCGLTTSSTCIYQYQYTVPASPVMGSWTIRVTANEGVEGVTDLGVGSFVVAPLLPSLTVLKTSTVLSDPTGSATPKRIPLAVVRYDILVTNSGPGTVDANTLVVTDPVPENSVLYVGGASPVAFINGSPVSGLTYNYATNVTYSSVSASGPFDYTPVPDANGFDAAVRAVRIAPGGVMAGASGTNPSFTLQLRVRIN
jgi:uncharacterized repeat protein (TIGR01451 family)